MIMTNPSIKLMETIVRCISTNPRKGYSVKNWELDDHCSVVKFDFMGIRYRVALVGTKGDFQVEEVVGENGGVFMSSDDARALRDILYMEARML